MPDLGRLAACIVVVCAAWIAAPASASEFDRALPDTERPEFVGNKTFSRTELLSESLLDFHTIAFWRRNTPYRRNTFAKEMRRIQEYYRARGFGSVSVALDTLYMLDANRVRPRVLIHEGPRTTIRDIRFSPQPVLSLDELRSILPFRTGDPYPYSLPLRGRATLLVRLAFLSRGYLNVVVQDSTAIDADSTNALLTYRMVPGPRFSIHGIFVSGAKTTRRELVDREMRIRVGDTYSYARIEESQRNLYATGLFRNVTIREDSADAEHAKVDLVVRIAERRMAFVEPSAGIGQRDAPEARGALAIGHRNLLGRGHSVELSATVAKNLNARRYLFESHLRYAQPHFLGSNVRFSPEIAYIVDRRRDDVHVTTLQLDFPASTRLTQRVVIAGAATLSRNVTEVAGQKLEPGEVLTEDDLSIRALSMTLARNAQDNPLDPRHGSVASISAQRAGFGGEAAFARLSGFGARYFSRGRTILALGLRSGWIEPHGSEAQVGIRGVPFSYLFQGGGSSTVRGFSQNSLGVQVETRRRVGNGFAVRDSVIQQIAGTVLLVANVELRRPLPLLPQRWNFGMGVFVDAGNVWESARDFRRARFGPRLHTDALPQTDVHYGIGVGIRWMQPFGPLRVDYGLQLNNLSLKKGIPHFAVGHAF